MSLTEYAGRAARVLLVPTLLLTSACVKYPTTKEITRVEESATVQWMDLRWEKRSTLQHCIFTFTDYKANGPGIDSVMSSCTGSDLVRTRIEYASDEVKAIAATVEDDWREQEAAKASEGKEKFVK